MKAVTAFLLVVCYFGVSEGNGRDMAGRIRGRPRPTVSAGWSCTEAPRLYQALQVDAGLGKVVVTTSSRYAYFLMGNAWIRMSAIRMKHTTVGHAGTWATGTNNRVYKFVCGTFKPAGGLSLMQVDAGGDDQVVGAAANNLAYCLRSSRTLAFNGAGSLSWDYLRRSLKYYSCGPMGCWGVDRNDYVYVAKSVNTDTCGHSLWTRVIGSLKMVEVGTDGKVFGVNRLGKVYQRMGITNGRRQGTNWVQVPMCMAVRHVSWDLGKLWVVTNSGLLMKCAQ